MKRRNFLKALGIIPAIPVLGKAVFSEPPKPTYKRFKGLRDLADKFKVATFPGWRRQQWPTGNAKLLELVATKKLKR